MKALHMIKIIYKFKTDKKEKRRLNFIFIENK